MNESDARSVLLVRAYETVPPVRTNDHWTDDDHAWATQAALQVEGENASAEALISRRGRLGAERLCSRDRAAATTVRALTWQPWVGWAALFVAALAGVATDAIGASNRINVLAPPLLAVIVWNLAVYLVGAARGAARLAGASGWQRRPLARSIARAAHAAMSARRRNRLTPPLAGFARDWAVASAPLTAARVSRILHASAALFAAGALAGMYVRGLALEYRAGWESTFLDAGAVHAILSTVLGPAAAITGITLPDEAGFAALRAGASDGESAARWIHLYAVTVTLLVLVPRALLALAHHVAVRRITRRFPLALDDGYFRSIAREQRGEVAEARVVPYSYRPSPQATLGLNALMSRALGARTEVSVAPTVSFGGEDALDSSALPDAPIALVVALFSLTATPERENHGVFVESLLARTPRSTPLAVLVDESGFRRRFDEPGGTGTARLSERRGAWQRMLAADAIEPVFVDLEQHDFSDARRALRASIDASIARTAGPES